MTTIKIALGFVVLVFCHLSAWAIDPQVLGAIKNSQEFQAGLKEFYSGRAKGINYQNFHDTSIIFLPGLAAGLYFVDDNFGPHITHLAANRVHALNISEHNSLRPMETNIALLIKAMESVPKENSIILVGHSKGGREIWRLLEGYLSGMYPGKEQLFDRVIAAVSIGSPMRGSPMATNFLSAVRWVPGFSWFFSSFVNALRELTPEGVEGRAFRWNKIKTDKSPPLMQHIVLGSALPKRLFDLVKLQEEEHHIASIKAFPKEVLSQEIIEHDGRTRELLLYPIHSLINFALLGASNAFDVFLLNGDRVINEHPLDIYLHGYSDGVVPSVSQFLPDSLEPPIMIQGTHVTGVYARGDRDCYAFTYAILRFLRMKLKGGED